MTYFHAYFVYQEAYSKMEKFLEIPTVLDNSSTIEGLLQRLAEAEDHQAYQIWDELLTQFESFCLYKQGYFNFKNLFPKLFQRYVFRWRSLG